ncbi:MAG: hypothetical protein IJI44_06825 [Erysipelotrichaceae bacterium]|nr:hypothetical protein [Erysipelotrichaceae bacterium]
MNELLLERLKKEYEVRQLDIGKDAVLSRKGLRFEIASYEVNGLGHLCTMSMKGMMGLMKMETCVLSATEKDLPLFNLDRITAMGKNTQIVEFYDDQLVPLKEETCDRFMAIKEASEKFEDYVSGEHWYDSILYPFTYAQKNGKGKAFDAVCERYIEEYLKLAKETESCDPAQKKQKVEVFARELFTKGGPAVNQFKKLFGEETAERVVVKHMYGAKL